MKHPPNGRIESNLSIAKLWFGAQLISIFFFVVVAHTVMCVCASTSAWFCESTMPSIKRSKYFRLCYRGIKVNCMPIYCDFSAIPALFLSFILHTRALVFPHWTSRPFSHTIFFFSHPLLVLMLCCRCFCQCVFSSSTSSYYLCLLAIFHSVLLSVAPNDCMLIKSSRMCYCYMCTWYTSILPRYAYIHDMYGVILCIFAAAVDATSTGSSSMALPLLRFPNAIVS